VNPQAGFEPHVMTLGAGTRRALALHCTMAFGGAWKGLSDAMPELTLVAPDMPSHGRSADWDEASSFGDTVFAASLAAMDAAPMDVIGHSFGAMTALRMAVRHPERIRSLTVIEPVFFAIPARDAPDSLGAHDVAAKPFKDAIATGDMETAARLFNKMWSTDAPKWNTLPERTRAAMVRGVHVVPDTYGLLYEDTAGLLDPGALDDLHVPTLVIRGEHAHPAITAVNDGLTARIPGAVQKVIAGAGHMAPISHPVLVAAEIGRLLALTA
jgi:pimeloyl-ACP methyl ester carboxylesterase